MVVFKSGSPLGVVMEIAHSGLTSDSANELEKTDGRGFAQSSALCHMKSKSCPRGGSCSEYQRVIEKGGKFINQPGCLGWNLEGTEKLIVPPMTEDDKLAVVKPGHRNSTASVAAAGAKDLCMRYGQSNVGPWEAWKTNDGAVREAIPAELSHEKLELSSTPFCDNMILFTRKPKQAMGNSHQSGREVIMQFFKSLGFKTQSRGANSSVADNENVFFVSLCKSSRDSELNKFKCSLADAKLGFVQLVCEMIAYGEKHRHLESAPSDLYDFFRTRHQEDMEALFLQHSSLVKAFECAQKIYFGDIDLTLDVPGTLNCAAYVTAAKSMGLEINNASKCGRNCVKMLPFEESGLEIGLKAYNKVAETMQQGHARLSNIDCKLARMINPSTNHLKAVVQDPVYNTHGITRYELTLKTCSIAEGTNQQSHKVPKFPAMLEILAKYASLLNHNTLITNSIQQHIQDMEEYVGRSIVVVHPNFSIEKQNAWRCRDKEATDSALKHLRDSLNELPDVMLLRYCNLETGKFNGNVFSTSFSKRNFDADDIWKLAAQVLAWATSSGKNPLLFVCVCGDTGQEFTNWYYRPIEIKRIGPTSDIPTYLTWNGSFGNGNYRNVITDWDSIGVNRDLLNNLRLQITLPEVIPNYESMGQLDISVDGSASYEPSVTVSTETREVLTGLPSCYPLHHHNGALAEEVPWQAYKICRKNQHSVMSLRFCVAHDWFQVPRCEAGDKLVEYLQKHDQGTVQTVVLVQYCDRDGFKWRIPSLPPIQIISGACKATRHLPVTSDHQVITGAGSQSTGRKDKRALYVCVGGVKYFLPQSISQVIEVKAKEKDMSIPDFLVGLKIYHPKSCFECVAGQKNKEEYLTIYDADSSTSVASNMKALRKRRERSDSELEGAAKRRQLE